MTSNPPFMNDRAHRGHLGPAWRHQLAQATPRRPGYGRPSYSDALVQQLQAYMALQASGDSGRERARSAFPAIAAAEDLNHDGTTTETMKIMTVAGMTPEQIAEHTAVPPAVVGVWRDIFFDLTDLRHSTSWLAAHVFEPERKQGRTALAARLKLAAAAGPAAARAIITANTNTLIDEADRIIHQKLRLQMKMEEATDFPLVSEKSLVTFLTVVARMQVDMKRLDLASERLVQQCTAAVNRHELAKLRLELKTQRESARQPKRRREQQRQHPFVRNPGPAKPRHASDPAAGSNVSKYAAAASPLAQLRWGSTPEDTAHTEIVAVVPFIHGCGPDDVYHDRHPSHDQAVDTVDAEADGPSPTPQLAWSA